VRGAVKSLGADCIEKPMRDEHKAPRRAARARRHRGRDRPAKFRRYGSARKLYNFHVDNAGAY
jgi:methylamine---glutamate N-methyltransferase subunit B